MSEVLEKIQSKNENLGSESDSESLTMNKKRKIVKLKIPKKNKISSKKGREASSDEDGDESYEPYAQNDDEHKKTEEEMQLENLVFGTDQSIMMNIDKLNERKKSSKKSFSNNLNDGKKVELADNFLERKPVWQDDDDQEM